MSALLTALGKLLGNSQTDYLKSDYAVYKDYTMTYEAPSYPTTWTMTTTTQRVRPFYHPASYSKRWKR